MPLSSLEGIFTLLSPVCEELWWEPELTSTRTGSFEVTVIPRSVADSRPVDLRPIALDFVSLAIASDEDSLVGQLASSPSEVSFPFLLPSGLG